MSGEKARVSVFCNSIYHVGEKNFVVDLFDMLECIKNDILEFKIKYQSYEHFVMIPRHDKAIEDIIEYLCPRFCFYENPFYVQYITIERYITFGGDESWE